MRGLLWRAAARLATDPRVQAKAADLFQKEVRPRAEALAQRAKPTATAVRDEVAQAARETDPLRDPKGFAQRVKSGVIRRRKS